MRALRGRGRAVATGDGREQGSVLVLALIVFTVLAIIVTALLSFVDTSFRTTSTVRSVVGEQYAAEGAIDQRISTMRDDPLIGRAGLPCPDYAAAPVNGTSVTVTCTPATGSGAATGGSGTSTANSPGQAILTLAGSGEDGLRQTSNSGLLVRGDVIARSTINNTASTAVLSVEGAVRAKLGCSGTIVSTAVPPVKECAFAGAVTDPGYAVPSALPGYVAAPSCPTGSYVALSPGYYDDSRALTNLTGTTCAGRVVHMTPGAYYFNFQDAASTWTITGGSRVVGGTPLGWTPSTATVATVPFPNGCDVNGGGVVIILGGSSRIDLTNGKAELCPPPNTSSQRFSLYGLSTGAATTASTTRSAATATASIGTPTFSNPQGAAAPDTARAVLTATGNNQDAALELTGFDLPGALPAGSEVTSVALRARYDLTTSARVDSLQATITPGTGSASTITDAGNGCSPGASTAPKLCRNGDGSYDVTVDVTSAFGAGGVWSEVVPRLTGARVSFAARVSKNNNSSDAGRVAVDALQLVVGYRAPAFVAQSGCLTVIPYGAAGSCASLQTSGSQADLLLHGTVYVPLSPLDIGLTNSAAQVFGRGVVARTLRIGVTPSCLLCPTGPTIDLPAVSPAVTADRDVVLTATVGGRVVLRQQVRFSDATSPGSTVAVRQWSVTR